MKFNKELSADASDEVTLCVRVWIEMLCWFWRFGCFSVTLCVRVWIEMSTRKSLYAGFCVTLCVRVWIEMAPQELRVSGKWRHPLREGVD